MTPLKIDSVWKHRNGTHYTVRGFTNLSSTKVEYPATVIYEGPNGLIWSRPISDWRRSFTPVELQLEMGHI